MLYMRLHISPRKIVRRKTYESPSDTVAAYNTHHPDARRLAGIRSHNRSAAAAATAHDGWECLHRRLHNVSGHKCKRTTYTHTNSQQKHCLHSCAYCAYAKNHVFNLCPLFPQLNKKTNNISNSGDHMAPRIDPRVRQPYTHQC